MQTNDSDPNNKILRKFLYNVNVKTLSVTFLIAPACSFPKSINTIPMIGKTKKTIPKIGVTWCEQTVTAIIETERSKYTFFPNRSQLYISGKACINKAIPMILGNCPKRCKVSINELENTAKIAAYPAAVLDPITNKENLYTPVINNKTAKSATVNNPNFKPPTNENNAITWCTRGG